MAHTDKLAPYANATQAAFGIQLGLAYARNGLVDGMPVDLACAVQGVHNAIGFGCSFIPHTTPASMEANESALDSETATTEELCGKLEEYTKPQEEGAGFGALSIPWELVLPLLQELLRRLLNS